MSDSNTVEAKAEPAVTPQEVDFEAVIKAKDDEIAKVQTERDNYRKGLLKAKGKLPEEEDADMPPAQKNEELIRRMVSEQMLATREAQLKSEKDATLASALKRMKELEIALKNRGQVSTVSASGSNQENGTVTKSYFSAEQAAELKKKGFTDEMVKKAEENARKRANSPS